MSETDSPAKKRVRVDSPGADESEPQSSAEAKRVRLDLLEILDDSDCSGDRNPAAQDLATVMKFFEEEISRPSSSGSGSSLPDLGYLLEASDDELGLPPPSASRSVAEEDEDDLDILRGASEAVGFGQIWGFEDELTRYDASEIGVIQEHMEGFEESVVVEGLFDYSDYGFLSSDFSDVSWRQE